MKAQPPVSMLVHQDTRVGALTSEVPGSVLLKAVTAVLHESLAVPCTGRAAKERKQESAYERDKRSGKTRVCEFLSIE